MVSMVSSLDGLQMIAETRTKYTLETHRPQAVRETTFRVKDQAALDARLPKLLVS